MKGFKSYTRKLDWILSCCVEILSHVPDEGSEDESSSGFQQQKFLEYSLFARIILLRGNSFMWKNCNWMSWLKLNLEFLGFFFTFTYLLGGGPTQQIEVRRQLVGINSPSTIWVLDVKLGSSGLANMQLYLLSHLTSSPLKEFCFDSDFCFLWGVGALNFIYLLLCVWVTCLHIHLCTMWMHTWSPQRPEEAIGPPGTGCRWLQTAFRYSGKAVNAFNRWAVSTATHLEF